jgi:hypothetical protein
MTFSVFFVLAAADADADDDVDEAVLGAPTSSSREEDDAVVFSVATSDVEARCSAFSFRIPDVVSSTITWRLLGSLQEGN